MKVKSVEKVPVGELDKPKVGITGFECVRSDVSTYARNVQREVLSKIVHGESKEDILDYIYRKRSAVKKGEVDLEEIGIPSGIGQALDEYDTNVPHVRGSKFANKYFGTNLGESDKVKLIWLQGNKSEVSYETEDDVKQLGLGSTSKRQKVNQIDCICFQEPYEIEWDKLTVDWRQMAEKTVNSRLERIVDALDWDMSEIEGQQKLGGL